MWFPLTESRAGKGYGVHMRHSSTPPPPATVASRQCGSPPLPLLARKSALPLHLWMFSLFNFLTPPQGLLVEKCPMPWVGSGTSSLPGQSP